MFTAGNQGALSQEQARLFCSLHLDAGERGWCLEADRKANHKEQVQQQVLAETENFIAEFLPAKILKQAEGSQEGEAQGSLKKPRLETSKILKQPRGSQEGEARGSQEGEALASQGHQGSQAGAIEDLKEAYKEMLS